MSLPVQRDSEAIRRRTRLKQAQRGREEAYMAKAPAFILASGARGIKTLGSASWLWPLPASPWGGEDGEGSTQHCA